MRLFERPPIYALTHVLTGIVGAWYPIVLILAIVYQLLQYILNIRFFIFETTIRTGNSLIHTTMKVFEIFIGYILGRLLKKYVKQ